MTMPAPYPEAVFTGSLGDRAAGTWTPAQVVASGGFVTLRVITPTGWAQLFSVPAQQVQVRSAAQRITLVVGGRSYPILADPGAIGRANYANGMGSAMSMSHHLHHGTNDWAAHRMVGNVARGINQAGAARAFAAQGGGEFLAATRASGARVSRLGFLPLFAIGCGIGLVAVILVLVVTMALLGM